MRFLSGGEPVPRSGPADPCRSSGSHSGLRRPNRHWLFAGRARYRARFVLDSSSLAHLSCRCEHKCTALREYMLVHAYAEATWQHRNTTTSQSCNTRNLATSHCVVASLRCCAGVGPPALRNHVFPFAPLYSIRMAMSRHRAILCIESGGIAEQRPRIL